MLAWFSQQISVGKSPYGSAYRRDLGPDGWAYEPVTAQPLESSPAWAEQATAPSLGEIVRVLSIRQSFVELILRGEKKREYRSRPTKIRERVYLYASLKPSDYAPACRKVGAAAGELPTGVILGSVEIVDCVWDAKEDCYAFVLKNPQRLPKPMRTDRQPTPGFWRLRG